MIIRPTLKTKPTGEVVTVAECKSYAIIDFDDDNDLIDTMIKSAISMLDGYNGILGRCIHDQVWSFEVGCWPVEFPLLMPDVGTIEVSYLDEAGASQVLTTSSYELIDAGMAISHLVFKSTELPALYTETRKPITIDATFGYGVDDVPDGLKLIIKSLVRYWYDNRPASDIPKNIMSGLSNYRVMSL